MSDCCLLWLTAIGKTTLSDDVSVKTKKLLAVFSRDTSIKNSPVFYWYKEEIAAATFPLNAVNATNFPVIRR